MQAPYQQHSDQALELRAAHGDGDAFGELYNRHFGRVYDFVFRIVRDADEAADIAQETFLRAMKALKPGEKEASFSTWVFTIARNLALTRLGKAKTTIRFADPEQAEEEDQPGSVLHLIDEHRLGNPEEAARASDLAKLVWDAVAFLNPKESSVLDLHLRQGLESAEIAEVMGISKGNAYTILSRLKDSLEEAVVTLVMTRSAREKCQELDVLLTAQSGPLLSSAVRRLVMRHIDVCPICRDERKKLLSPASLFGAFAMVPIPLTIKQRVAESLRRQWPAHGPPEGASQVGHNQTPGVESGRGFSGGSARYPLSLGRFGMRQIRNFTVTWPYRTFRWKMLAVALFLAAMFGIGGGGALIANTSDGDGFGVVLPPSTATAIPPQTPTATPTGTPQLSPTATTNGNPPQQTPTATLTATPTFTPPPPRPSTPTTSLIMEPPSKCPPSSAVSESGDAVEDAPLAAELTKLTNQHRAEYDLPTLLPNDHLREAARHHAVFVLRSRWWVDHGKEFAIHCQPDGSDMYWRARCAGSPPRYVEKDVVYGTIPCEGYPPALVRENVAFGSVGRPPNVILDDILAKGHDPKDPNLVAMGLACYTRSDLNEYVCVQVMAGESYLVPR